MRKPRHPRQLLDYPLRYHNVVQLAPSRPNVPIPDRSLVLSLSRHIPTPFLLFGAVYYTPTYQLCNPNPLPNLTPQSTLHLTPYPTPYKRPE